MPSLSHMEFPYTPLAPVCISTSVGYLCFLCLLTYSYAHSTLSQSLNFNILWSLARQGLPTLLPLKFPLDIIFYLCAFLSYKKAEPVAQKVSGIAVNAHIVAAWRWISTYSKWCTSSIQRLFHGLQMHFYEYVASFPLCFIIYLFISCFCPL